jgi:hypothetical protein
MTSPVDRLYLALRDLSVEQQWRVLQNFPRPNQHCRCGTVGWPAGDLLLSVRGRDGMVHERDRCFPLAEMIA